MDWNWLVLLWLLEDDADVQLLKAGYSERERSFVPYVDGDCYYVVRGKNEDILSRIYDSCGIISRTVVKDKYAHYVREHYLDQVKGQIEKMGYTVSVGAF